MIDIKEAKPPKEHLTTYRLAHSLVAWLQQTYPEAHDLLAQDAQTIEDDIAPFFSPHQSPSEKLFVAYQHNEIAGMVALRKHSQEIGEMKLMFVDAPFRGQGLGRALAVTAINTARLLGYREMRLSTGGRQIAAQGLYRSLGFCEIPPYHAVSDKMQIVFMELRLAPSVTKDKE